MKTIFVLIISILAFLSACKQSKENSKLFDNSIESVNTIDNIENIEQFIQNDSIVRIWLSQIKKLSKSNNIFIRKDTIFSNKYDKNITDTVRTLTFNRSEIKIYIHQSSEIVVSTSLKDPKVSFSDKIKIGISKPELERILDIRITSNKLVITNLEQTVLFIFSFENDNLKLIQYEGYVD